jgi:hypothetical protein
MSTDNSTIKDQGKEVKVPKDLALRFLSLFKEAPLGHPSNRWG